jgi:hypothetical protein
MSDAAATRYPPELDIEIGGAGGARWGDPAQEPSSPPPGDRLSPVSAFKQVPPDLFRRVEPEAGEVLPVTRWRHEEEFRPHWDYIYSAAASNDAVVAALCCSLYVYEENWARTLASHAPAAMRALRDHSLTLRQYCQGECPDDVGARLDQAINASLGGYLVVVLFPVGDLFTAGRSRLSSAGAGRPGSS